ncbi:MAG: hypothetical protein OEX02_08420 [Cyclobacteriaceae bacterium]|nr:hypothetical protein [Cyclobacteriaceae bacterium]
MDNNYDEGVFLITEGWSIPGTFEKFKAYRIKVLEILEAYGPEFIFYSHPFEWAFGSGDGEFPTGMEVCRFKDEDTARAAIEKSGVRKGEKEVFYKIRSYISRFATQQKWKGK